MTLNKLKYSESSNQIIDRNKEYYDIIDAIKKRFEAKYSPIFDLGEKILDGICTGKGDYHLLLGLVQSGKSLMISWLVWSLNFRREFHKPTIILTINLDTVRRDFMSKIGPNGIVQQIVFEVCSMEFHLSREEIEYFFCPRPFDLTKLKGMTSLEIGQVPILIMQPHNYRGVIRSFFKFATGPTMKVPILIMDEVHSMYSNTKEFIDNHGLTIKQKNTSRAMISWLLERVKKNNTAMIGITATPYRSMADTHVYPSKDCVYKLPLVSPFSNLKYYGEGGEGKVNIVIRPHYVVSADLDSAEVKKERKQLKLEGIFNFGIISEILDRAEFIVPYHETVVAREIPLIFITLERYNMSQDNLKDLIKTRFGDLVHVEVINQEGFPTLPEYFDNCLRSDKVCQEGACIIIGNQSLKAGISVKPPPGTTCMRIINNKCYLITGITDQISDLSSINGESHMQLLRLLGWYGERHQCNLWLSDELSKQNYYELYNIYKQFEDAYDGHPVTVSEINTTAHKICGGYCHYSRTTRSNSKVHKHFEKLEGAIELPNQVIKLEDLVNEIDFDYWALEEGIIRIGDLFKQNAKRQRLRSEIFKALKSNGIVFDETRFQIPTNAQRLKEILDSSFLPGDKDQWKVNSFLYGSSGCDTLLSESYIVWFDQMYDQRPILSQECECLTFWLGGTKWISATYKPIMEHKNLKFVDEPFSRNHEQIIEEMTKGAESQRENILTGWQLCMKACKIVMNNGSTSISKIYYNMNEDTKIEIQQIGKSGLSEGEKLEKIVEIVKRLFSSHSHVERDENKTKIAIKKKIIITRKFTA